MSDIGYRLSEPMNSYPNDEIEKSEFKRQVREVERSVDGANWWTVCSAFLDETHKSNYVELAEPLLELYNEQDQDLSRIFGSDVIEEASRC